MQQLGVQKQQTATVGLVGQQQQQQQGVILLNKTPSIGAGQSTTASGGDVTYTPQQLVAQMTPGTHVRFQQHQQIIQQQQQAQHVNATTVQIRASSLAPGTSLQHHQQQGQYSLAAGGGQQQMIIVRQQAPPMIVVSAAGGGGGVSQPGAGQQQQHPMLLQQGGGPIRVTTLNRGLAPGGGVQQRPTQHQQFMTTTSRQPHPLNVTLSAGGPILGQQQHVQSVSSGDHQILTVTAGQHQQQAGSGYQQQSSSSSSNSLNLPPSLGLNLDLAGLSTAGQLTKTDGDVTPLTPQDQLSRYVDQL